MKEAEFAGFEDLLDFFADGVAYAFYCREFFGWQVLDGLGEFFERKGGHGVGFCFEGVLAVDVHELGKEAELVGYMVVSYCHGAKVRCSWQCWIWGMDQCEGRGCVSGDEAAEIGGMGGEDRLKPAGSTGLG